MAILTADAQLVFGFRTQTYGNKSSEIPNILVQATAGFNFAQTISVTPIIFRGGVISLEPAASVAFVGVHFKGLKENLVVESQCNLLLPTGISIDFSKLGIAWDLETDFTFEMEEDFVREEEGNQTPLPAIANLLTFRTPTWYYAAINSNFSQNTIPLRIKQLAASFPQALGNITFKITYNPGRFASLFVNNITMTPVVVKRVRGAAAFNSEFNRVINNLRVRYHDSAMTNTFSFTQPSEQGRIRFATPSLTNDVIFYLDPTFTFRPSPSLTAVSTIASTPYVDWVSGANINSQASIVNTPTVLWYALSSITASSSINYNIELTRPFESNQTVNANVTSQISYVTSSVTINAQATSSMSITADIPFLARIAVSANDTITFAPRGTVNATVEWGDGVIESWTTATNKSHTYSPSQAAGVVTIKITGTLTQLGDNSTRWYTTRNLGANEGILTLGEIGLTKVANMCTSGDIVPVKLPTSLTSLYKAFYNRIDGSEFPAAVRNPVSAWNTVNITDMSYMFAAAGLSSPTNGKELDERLWNNWNTSNVTNMSHMFNSTYYVGRSGPPNVAIFENWDVSSVTDMSFMFYDATGFGFVAAGATMTNWDVSSVTNMAGMFGGTDSNNTNGRGGSDCRVTDVALWDVSSVTNMAGMFENAETIRMEDGITTSYFKNIGLWNTSNVTNMSYMFYRAQFNRDIGLWDTGSVTSMAYMFYNVNQSLEFNKNIQNWDVSNVSDMTSMFQANGSFNQNLTVWCIPLINSEPSNFGGSPAWTQKPVWGTCGPVVGINTLNNLSTVSAISIDNVRPRTFIVSPQASFTMNVTPTTYEGLTLLTFNGSDVFDDYAKFGTKSLLVNEGGTSTTRQYAEIFYDDKLNLGNGDFTIEFFLRNHPNEGNVGDNIFDDGAEIFDWTVDNTTVHYSMIFENNIGRRIKVVAPSFTLNGNLFSGDWNVSDWNHIALVRSSGTVAIYLNGNRKATASHNVTLDSSINLVLGNTRQRNNNNPTSGTRFDEFRISNSARYTGTTYTVPTAAFVPDANTLALFHFESSVTISGNSKRTYDDVYVIP